MTTRPTLHRAALVLALAAPAAFVAGCSKKTPSASAEAAKASTAETAQAAAASETANASGAAEAEETLPPDGYPLFRFLLAKIPRLAEKVPCSCCPNKIAGCYRGACPASCGPCNRIGRDAYRWHKQGLTDDQVVARVKTKYNIR